MMGGSHAIEKSYKSINIFHSFHDTVPLNYYWLIIYSPRLCTGEHAGNLFLFYFHNCCVTGEVA